MEKTAPKGPRGPIRIHKASTSGEPINEASQIISELVKQARAKLGPERSERINFIVLIEEKAREHGQAQSAIMYSGTGDEEWRLASLAISLAKGIRSLLVQHPSLQPYIAQAIGFGPDADWRAK